MPPNETSNQSTRHGPSIKRNTYILRSGIWNPFNFKVFPRSFQVEIFIFLISLFFDERGLDENPWPWTLMKMVPRVSNKFNSGSALFLPKSHKMRLKKAPTNFFKKRHNLGQKRLKFDPPNNFYCIFMH